MLLPEDIVVWDSEVDLEDSHIVGDELSKLGELSSHKVPVYPRIIVTPRAFELFLKENNLSIQIKHLLGTINYARHDSLSQIADYIGKLIIGSPIPKDISKLLFEKLEKPKVKAFDIDAYYFKDNKYLESSKWASLVGESVIVDNIRTAWTHLFSAQNLKRQSIHHQNHHTFSVCLSVSPVFETKLSGTIKTFGKSKKEFEIEAHTHVKFVYSKQSKSLINGHVQPGGSKTALSASDIRTLLSYAHKSEKVLYLPQTMGWVKVDNHVLINSIIPTTESVSYKNEYDILKKNLTVNPGITIGRLKVVDARQRTVDIRNDEIIILDSLDRQTIEFVKKAKGLILKQEPHPELIQVLRNIGIPTLVQKNDMLYSTGDVISLNATTGEIKRGSILV